VRGGTWERGAEAAAHGRPGLRTVRRSKGTSDLPRSTLRRPVRRSLGGCVWCSRGRGRGAGAARGPDAARGRGSVARRVGSGGHPPPRDRDGGGGGRRGGPRGGG